MNVTERRSLRAAIAAALPRFFLINDALVQRGTGPYRNGLKLGMSSGAGSQPWSAAVVCR